MLSKLLLCKLIWIFLGFVFLSFWGFCFLTTNNFTTFLLVQSISQWAALNVYLPVPEWEQYYRKTNGGRICLKIYMTELDLRIRGLIFSFCFFKYTCFKTWGKNSWKSHKISVCVSILKDLNVERILWKPVFSAHLVWSILDISLVGDPLSFACMFYIDWCFSF